MDTDQNTNMTKPTSGPSDALMLRLIEECPGDVPEILRAWHGLPEVPPPPACQPSPWPDVAFWIAVGAVLCTAILMGGAG